MKKKYRDQIRQGNEDVKFIFLEGDFDLAPRMKQRQGHYMKVDMLKSQFATLETPQADESDVIHIDINAPLMRWLSVVSVRLNHY